MVAYDSNKQRVKRTDGWGYTRTFPVGEVWLPPAGKAATNGGRRRVYLTLIGVGAGLGAVIGSIITALLVR